MRVYGKAATLLICVVFGWLIWIHYSASHHYKVPVEHFENTTLETSSAHQHHNKPLIRSNARILLIVSYMRSGSTLTGDVLQHHKGTFYVFEPLHTVARRMIENKPIEYLDGSYRNATLEDFTDEFIKAELTKWMECRFEELDYHSLVDDFLRIYSRTARVMHKCRKGDRSKEAVLRCLPHLVRLCERAKLRLFKFIRLRMDIVASIIESYPNLRVLHLLRDPRGIMRSQTKIGKIANTELVEKSQNLCSIMMSDLEVTLHFYVRHHGRIFLLLYEELAENPLDAAKALYHYLGLPALKQILNYIYKLTLQGRDDTCHFCIIRGNSTATAYRWRDEISLEDVQIIDRNCKSIYNIVGYKALNSLADIRNHTLSTRNPSPEISFS